MKPHVWVLVIIGAVAAYFLIWKQRGMMNG